jgi:hypothetical protein
MKKKKKGWLYLCTQLTCKHFFEEFEIEASKMPSGYQSCPECECSAEYNGLNGRRLVDCIKIPK